MAQWNLLLVRDRPEYVRVSMEAETRSQAIELAVKQANAGVDRMKIEVGQPDEWLMENIERVDEPVPDKELMFDDSFLEQAFEDAVSGPDVDFLEGPDPNVYGGTYSEE